jgi:adenylate cyclase, class 2
MLEIEVKCPVADFEPVRHTLAEWGAHADPPRQEADHYFNAPDRDFARTDEALRLRRIGQHNWITYKGPKRDQQTKTRTEIELPLGDGDQTADDFARLVQHLGYRPVAVVRKERTCYHVQRDGFDLEITLDMLAGLGRYVEVEIRGDEQSYDTARACLLRTVAELGLKETERRSYLELLLAQGGATQGGKG